MTLDGKPAAGLAIFQLPGLNALDVADRIKARMREMEQRFPKGVRTPSPTTPRRSSASRWTRCSTRSATRSSWWPRGAAVPAGLEIAAPARDRRGRVAGRHLRRHEAAGFLAEQPDAVRAGAGHRHRGRRRHRRAGEHRGAGWTRDCLREATIKAMDEITGPIMAITLVLSSVLLPSAFLGGIAGQFFRQFALTIAASMSSRPSTP